MNIGLLGGGQLGLMMVEAAKKFGVSVTVYEKKKICPAASACDELVVGDYEDKLLFIIMTQFASFAIGGFVPSAAIAGVLVLIGLGAFFYLGLKGPTDY